MQQRERISCQRALAREALGKLKAAGELFGSADEIDLSSEYGERINCHSELWEQKVAELESWIFDESPLA